jgi:hypothetical protein
MKSAWKILNVFPVYWVGLWLVHCPFPCNVLAMPWVRKLGFTPSECWNSGFFERTTLHSLGYVCYLGHGGNAYPTVSPHHQLTIINANGWHKLEVIFCKCGASDVSHQHYHQLLRMCWYPVSFNHPKTVFTFNLLDTYHKVTLQGKLNLYDFYHAIMQKSDNQGRFKPLVSDFLCQWLFVIE